MTPYKKTTYCLIARIARQNLAGLAVLGLQVWNTLYIVKLYTPPFYRKKARSDFK